ncbi:MAG TPA: hypothetical protein IAB44_04775 [Candidatus Limivivens intestinipullorum]|uniref:Uncharacterized protein n=1 Tax=Candidatus Limivivens intestinipullorum TaxID=2840858 RepID=A0A9D1ERB4_9FIRM|nr:hypothetical protein [Candidatus Limivivens intestinipullorum]
MKWIDSLVIILMVFAMLFLCLILYSVVRVASKISRNEENNPYAIKAQTEDESRGIKEDNHE